MSAARVLLIYTGGTIGMVQDASSKQLKPFDFSELTKHIPELNRLDVEIETKSFDTPIDSSDMNPEHWAAMVRIIESNYDEFDGFVILHGSDTMAFTASALSFMLENLAKPVVLTGSQLPIGVIRTDGKENVITAIEIAAAKHNGAPIVPEVCVYFEYQLYRGNRTHKRSAQHFDAFITPNYPVLAEAGITIQYNHNAIRAYNSRPLTTRKNLNTNIGVLSLYPGITQSTIEPILYNPQTEAIIMRTFGSGNGSTNPAFIQSLELAIRQGKIIYNVTQCNAGSVNQGQYETSGAFQRIGVVSGFDITFEAAITKLMYLLGSGLSHTEVKSYLTQDLRGEITVGAQPW